MPLFPPSYDMVKSKDWAPLLARTVRWRYLVLDEGAWAGLGGGSGASEYLKQLWRRAAAGTHSAAHTRRCALN